METMISDPSKNTEFQRKFKAKMYEAGFWQKQIWLKQKKRVSKIDLPKFIEKVKKLTLGMSEEGKSELFNLFIQIIEAKKEMLKKKETA
jgi:hypothetical protein